MNDGCVDYIVGQSGIARRVALWCSASAPRHTWAHTDQGRRGWGCRFHVAIAREARRRQRVVLASPDMDPSALDALPLRTLAIAAGVLVALLVLWKFAFPKRASTAHTTSSTCPSCGWTGAVSRYKGVCPKCAAKLS